MSNSALMVAIVDDEEPVRRAFGRLLRSAGLEVETFSSGDAFLQSLEHRRPDCLILDLHMPALNGFEVQARMAAAGKQVPTVFVTGHESPGTREQALKGGATAFLRKPVDDQALLGAIEAAVEESK